MGNMFLMTKLLRDHKMGIITTTIILVNFSIIFNSKIAKLWMVVSKIIIVTVMVIMVMLSNNRQLLLR